MKASDNQIRVRGARTHNLRNISLDIPRNRLVVITGLSGSGKSSLAFDTLYAEGQRRYVESLSAYARQFLQLMEKPDVDLIEGLSPAIAIEQKSTSHNPRSTVGTVTEIHDYLRLLFSRTGTPYCPDHPDQRLETQTVSQMVDAILALPEGTRLMILAPVVHNRKGEHVDLFEELQAQGFVRVRIRTEGQKEDAARIVELNQVPALNKQKKHSIDVVVDRLKVSEAAKQRLAESLETALNLANGRAIALPMPAPAPTGATAGTGAAGTAGMTDGTRGESGAATDTAGTADTGNAGDNDTSGHGTDIDKPLCFSSRFGCPVCNWSLPELEPRLFSFNNPLGACPECDGLGHTLFFDPARIVQFPNLSLGAGAIRGWDRRNQYYYQQLQSLAAHYGFDLELPFEELPEKARNIILFGSGTEQITFTQLSANGKPSTRTHPFEGIVHNFERRYQETDSNHIREELAKFQHTRVCPACQGTRLRIDARHVRVGPAGADKPIWEVSAWTLGEAARWFEALKLEGARAAVGERIVREITSRLRFLNDVGLDYLSLERSAESLSGGEAQRIRLASQIGSGLTGVMYVLDEPSIGLHQRDNDRLLKTLLHLRDLGNSVLVVEHDEDAIRAADHVIDMGLGAGEHGGEVIAQGPVSDIIANPDSITGQYLSGARRIAVPAVRKAPDRRQIRIIEATGNNLKEARIDIPVGLLVCVTGVSGSGKSTLINDTLYKTVARQLYRAQAEPSPCTRIDGLEHFDKVIAVDQSPIGRTPRSNPATYTGLFTPIRELFAEVPAAKERGYGPGRFSFNVKGGRCEACEGDGMIKVEMHFLPDVYVPCDVCKGKRYNRETLEIQYKGKSIADVLGMTVEDAHAFFSSVPQIARRLKTLLDVGLGYIRLGQSATTLSGGEAQRVKLSQELSKRDTGRTLYILDEPTTGLHFQDIALLLDVIIHLRDQGNTIVIIEHNLDVIKTADWIIDMGPEGGAGGGRLVVAGTPETVAACPQSHTGRHLEPLLKG
ncbi:MAG: excinuclease ABC subunit UvrA [Lautropia sp.]|nr:excinuclease ABC subunit UvrA [Lautropia sp.]